MLLYTLFLQMLYELALVTMIAMLQVVLATRQYRRIYD